MKKYLAVIALATATLSANAIDWNAYNLGAISWDNTRVGANYGAPFAGGSRGSVYLNGFGFEYTHGFGISSLSMYIEAGAKLSFGFNSENYYREEINESGVILFKSDNNEKINLIRLSIPISYAYKFSFDKFAVTPYAGFDFRFNLGSTSQYTSTTTYLNQQETILEKWNNFNKNEVPDPFHRFQFGWHIGVRAEFMNFFAGLNYGTDFVPLMEEKKIVNKNNVPLKYNTGNFALSLGYSF